MGKNNHSQCLISKDLTPNEEELIDYLRRLDYGRVTIFVEQGNPIRVEEGMKSVKFGGRAR